jgi:hypothetical protein
MKLRFSLRAMLVLVTCAALACWWRDQPRRNANEFVEAVENGRYAAADAMFLEGTHPFMVRVMEGDDRNSIAAQRRPQTPGEWLRGECLVEVRVEDFRGLGATITLNVVATSGGIERHGEAESITAIKYAPDPILHEHIRR